MSDRAVFFDPSRRRWWWIKRIGTFFGLFAVVTISLFALSLVTVPFLPYPDVLKDPIRKTISRIPLPHRRPERFLLKKEKASLLASISRENQRQRVKAAQPPIQAPGIVAAFYAPWQETGLNSLNEYANHMTHLMPSWVHLNADGKSLDFHDWDPVMVPHNNDVLKIARANNLNIVPVFSNAQLSDFDPQRAHTLLTDPAKQTTIIFQLRRWLLVNRFQGINIDFENLQPDDYPRLIPFLRRIRMSFAPSHLIVTADLADTDNTQPLWKPAASICDFVVVMAYDEHGSASKPGPIASIDWYRGVLNDTKSIPRNKLVIGLANYAYDWQEGRDWADPMTYQGALIEAARYREGEKPEDIVDFDEHALNPTFDYDDFDGNHHTVWFLDAVTAANQWLIAQNYNPRGVAIWVLGSTDPSIWKFIHRDHLRQRPSLAALGAIHFPFDLEFVGDGEIAHVDATPQDGSRKLEIDPRTGIALDETYQAFPKSYVISRKGYKPGLIALTIDDGPAAPYTAQMLDVLKKYNVKATFFLIGQNAERYPNLVRRIWNEGHEIGNHSYTHPNLAAMPLREARLELTATQRVFQSILHRSTLLFRPPYNADAEPSSANEVDPIVLGTQMHYVTVLELLDPQDWNTDVRMPDGTLHHRAAKEMLDSLLTQIATDKGSSILLHDGGGDRSETVKLIPMLIETLRSRGYRFVTVSELMGATRDAVNPPVNEKDTLMLASDRIVFDTIYVVELTLTIAFLGAIILGGARVLFVTVLAIIAKFKARRVQYDESYRPSVSVVIAAFNEEKVIARTIRAVLTNRYEPLNIIVVDDGSTDDTSGEVTRAFGEHPKVALIRQENAGKASALNRGIGAANGEIIIALDADTIFARGTIANLVRHFHDPVVGAVAGNVKVGNRMNPLTYWQSIEYVTSQNLDRRAYAIMNAVTVVPGAVGAWRRDAVLQAGGYSTDTMAEDMDLTWRIRRAGYRIDNESDAVGYTEVPDSFRALFRQRFRWAFGTLQCLWKHRSALGRYGWFGTIGLPSLWLFSVVFQALSPLMDLEILWTLINVSGNWALRGALTHDWYLLPQAVNSLVVIGFMYAFFFVIELIGSIVAFRLDREDSRVLVWLLWQRFLYRQLMYAVLVKSLSTALAGMRAGWGKLDRKGTVDLAIEPADLATTELQP